MAGHSLRHMPQRRAKHIPLRVKVNLLVIAVSLVMIVAELFH